MKQPLTLLILLVVLCVFTLLLHPSQDPIVEAYTLIMSVIGIAFCIVEIVRNKL